MATIQTTIKTDICSFSEYRIYPGRGMKFIAKDGKVHYFIASKQASLADRHIRPVRLTWTQAYRRKNKKLNVDSAQKKRRGHRRARLEKAIVGLSLDEIHERREQRLQSKKLANDEDALKDAKAKAKKAQSDKANKTKNVAANKMNRPVVSKHVKSQRFVGRLM